MLGVLGFLSKEPLFSRVTLPSVGSPENCPGTGCDLGLIFMPLTNASSSWLSTNKGAMETISVYSRHPFSISSATYEHQLLLWPWNLGDETLWLGPLPCLGHSLRTPLHLRHLVFFQFCCLTLEPLPMLFPLPGTHLLSSFPLTAYLLLILYSSAQTSLLPGSIPWSLSQG